MGHTVLGKQVGNIGYGLMSLTWVDKALSDEDAFAAMKTALETGSTYWNGGEFYGPPHNNSLTLLRKFYDKYPEAVDKVVLNIKGCINLPTFHPDSSPEGVKKSIEMCLDMLGPRGKIDQFEAARKDPNVDIEVTMKAMQEFVEAGKIGAISLSEVGADTIRRAAKVAKIGSVEIELSLWSRDPLDNGILTTCHELGIPVLAYSPLGRGFLTGKIQSADDLNNSMLKHHPRFQQDALANNMKLVREVEKLAKSKGCTPGQIAIAWILAISKRPGMPVIIPIPGSKNPSRIKENSTEIELTEADLAEIDKILADFTVIGGRYPENHSALLNG